MPVVTASNHCDTDVRALVRLAVLAATVAIVVLVSGCATTWGEVQGAHVSAGVSLDHELNVSPVVEAGYDYWKWKDFVGWGGSAGLRLTPIGGRADVFVETGAFAAPLFGLPLTPYVVGGALALTRRGLAPAMRFGATTLAWKPPEACREPLFGEDEDFVCPPGLPSVEHVDYPRSLPRIDYRFTLVWADFEDDEISDCALCSHSLTAGATFADHALGGTDP